MLAGLKNWVARMSGPATPSEDVSTGDAELRAATALLLVEASALDGSIDAAEEQAVRRLLDHWFGLAADEIEDLLADARAKVESNVELYGVTRVIKQNLAPDERVAVLEMLWEVAYADGELHDFEANLVRRVAGLLHVSDKASGEARKRVLSRLEADGIRA